jgi:glycosyltransferase involved in cell wall biosynthesis
VKENNFLYITWGEVIIENGIFKNQVLEQLKLIKNERPNATIFLLSGLPLGNMRLIKRTRYFLKELQKIETECSNHGIIFKYRFISGLSPWFYTPPQKLWLFDFTQKKFLKKFIERNSISIVHCRSYTPARLALEVRKKYKLSYKVIFDTRGNFPEEGLLKSHLDFEGYRFWKKMEKDLLDNADVVVNVSSTFTEHVKKISNNPNVYTIYTSTNLSSFYPLALSEKNKLRRLQNISEHEKVLVYLGELSEIGWHQTSTLIDAYQAFKKAFVKTKMLVITHNKRDELEKAFLDESLEANELIVVKGTNQEEVNDYLNLADFAVLPFRHIRSQLDETLGYTMIASKTGEYLATGLPVIVNNKIGAASQLVEETGTGITYELEKENDIISKLLDFEKEKKAITAKCCETASNTFDAKKNALMYLGIYDQVLNKKAEMARIA